MAGSHSDYNASLSSNWTKLELPTGTELDNDLTKFHLIRKMALNLSVCFALWTSKDSFKPALSLLPSSVQATSLAKLVCENLNHTIELTPPPHFYVLNQRNLE